MNETKGYAKPTHGALNPTANQSRVDSRTSLFEQEIAQQQQQLKAQQHRTLQEFSQAIQNETGAGNSEGALHRSGSLSSVDSLEEQKVKHEPVSNHHQSVSTAVDYGVSSNSNNRNFVPNTAQDSGFNYSLHHNDVLLRGSFENTRDVQQATSTATGTSNANFVTNTVSSGMGTSSTATTTTAPNVGYGTSSVGYRTGREDIQDKSVTSQAWATSKANKPPVQSHASAPTANASQRSRPYSARTTATAVTVAPAVSYPVKTHDIQQQMSAMSPSVAAMNEAIEGHIARLANPVDESRSPAVGVGKQELLQPSEEEAPQVPSPPKSILKWHKTDTPTKDKKSKGLAAAIMKDSLEIGKQSGMKSPKKSVRWTDMHYSDDESMATQGTNGSSCSSKAKTCVRCQCKDCPGKTWWRERD